MLCVRRREAVVVPTSFWVTVSMMVPKAGMVDIRTELRSTAVPYSRSVKDPL